MYQVQIMYIRNKSIYLLVGFKILMVVKTDTLASMYASIDGESIRPT